MGADSLFGEHKRLNPEARPLVIRRYAAFEGCQDHCNREGEMIWP